MDNHKHCPTCDSRATEVMDTQYHADTIERIRQCMEPECRTQYTVEYGRPEITNTKQL